MLALVAAPGQPPPPRRAGERLNDADWAQVAEEIADVGLAKLYSIESVLRLIMVLPSRH